jgi:hypothetical protein
VPQTVATRIAPVVIAPPTRMTTGEDVAAPRPNLPGSFLFSQRQRPSSGCTFAHRYLTVSRDMSLTS